MGDSGEQTPRLRLLDEPQPAADLRETAEFRMRPLQCEVDLQSRRSVPKTAVYNALGRAKARQHLTPFVEVLHGPRGHLREDALPSMRRLHRDGIEQRCGQHAAGDVQLQRVGQDRSDDVTAVEGRKRPSAGDRGSIGLKYIGVKVMSESPCHCPGVFVQLVFVYEPQPRIH